ncbi:hypothetical protein C8J57DRAFT_1495398 [Mycena rebaudengoi]|nr:hypothetical protein C8J57DRAFT_1495398 [Mycena rebaudengoi]
MSTSSPSSYTFGDSPTLGSPHYERFEARKSFEQTSSSASVHSWGDEQQQRRGGRRIGMGMGMARRRTGPPPPPPLQVSGPYALSPGRPRGTSASDSMSTTGSVWNMNSGKAKSVRGKSPAPSQTPAKPAAPVKEKELGRLHCRDRVVRYRGAGADMPPKKVKDPERSRRRHERKEREKERRREKEREKEMEKERKREEKRMKEREKERQKEKARNGSIASTSVDVINSRIALLEGAGYGYGYGHGKLPKPKSPKPKSKDDSRGSVIRRASDLTSVSNQSITNSNGVSRTPSRGRSGSTDPSSPRPVTGMSYVYPRSAPEPPSAFPRPRSPPRPSSRGPAAPSADNESAEFNARRSTWLAAPALYACRVVHPCQPPAAVAYFGFPFFALEEHALLGVLHEAGHPSTHPRLPLYVDDGEDCLLLCRDADNEIGWALASFLAPLAAD